MNKLIAIGLACCIPTGLAAEDPAEGSGDAQLGTVSVLVIEEAAPAVKDVMCAGGTPERASTDCMTVHRAVLTARIQKVSARERGRWM